MVAIQLEAILSLKRNIVSCRRIYSKMDTKPIEGFARRPRNLRPIILPEIIVISDGDSDGQSTVENRNVNLAPSVKCEAIDNDETASEISIPDDVLNDSKKRRKKKEKNQKGEGKKRKSKRKFKKEISSEESYSDSDSSSDVHKRRVKHKSQSSSSTFSSTGSESDSSDHGSRRKKSYHRSKMPKRAGKKRHNSSRRYRRNNKNRNSKRVKRERRTTDESTDSESPSSPDNFVSFMASNKPQKNSNQVPTGSSRDMDVEVNASVQNHTSNSISHYDSSMPEITSNFNVLTTMTANGNGYGTQALDQTVPLAGYVDDGQVAGTSRQSAALDDDEEMIQHVYSILDNMTQISAPHYAIVENSNEQPSISYTNPIVNNLEPANDQNNLLQLIPSDESDQEQQDEQMHELNVQRSGRRKTTSNNRLNLQRPRKNTDKMLYLTNPERANVCVFCYDSCTNIVNHYKKKHPTEEVYVSRISPKMADRLRRDDFKRFDAKCEKYGSFWKLYAKCFFCEYPRFFNLSYWIDHIRVHTGEYTHLCTVCGAHTKSHGHCGTPSELIGLPHNLVTDDLMCFVCKLCNFVQIERKNMHSHLIKQHDFKKDELESKYDKRVLVPSKSTVCKEMASTTAQRANGIVPINQQENARNIRVIDEIILNALNNGTSESNTPELNVPESNVPELNVPEPIVPELILPEPDVTEPNEPTQDGTKRESGWEQRLEANYPRYITDDNNENIVNPWLRKTIILPANLFDFFKCMHPNCIFSTNEKTAFQQHIKDHYTHHDFGTKRGDPIDIHKKSRNCPYCNLGPFKSVNQLWDHMENIHGSCTYQCSHCYYRCIEMDSIVLHYEKFHPNQEKNIYVVNTERKFGADQMDRMSDDERNLTQFHEFECSYCNDFESSQLVEMRKHLTEHHSSEFMFVLRRGQKDEYIYVGAMSQWNNFKFFRCGQYKAMSPYLDWDEQNHRDQPQPFPLVPILRNDFGFEPSKLQIADDVKFVYRNYTDYKNSQTISFRCGRFTAEFLIENPQARGNSICRICGEYVGSNEYLRHLREHQKRDCYFIAEREDLILHHMRSKHSNQMRFYYRKFERKIVKSSIMCLFSCGNCVNQNFLCIRQAREHHSLCHPDDVETIKIDRLLNGENRILNETFSFKAYMFCAEPNVDGPISKSECSLPMTKKTLEEHHARCHASNEKQTYKRKLVLCRNDEILRRMSSET